MLCDLVKTTTPDGMRLDSALHLPEPGVIATSGLDAVIFLHGVGSNFYGSSLLEGLLPGLLGRGLAVLAANTRGHDTAYLTASMRGRRYQGAAFEVVDDCRLDVAAWLQFLVQRGYRRIGLLGHSLGAIKAVYSQAHLAHEAVAAVLALSPPRLSYDCFRRQPDNEAFLNAMSQAEAHVAAGQPEALMQVPFPFPMLIAAAGYVEKYGPAERYNILRFVHQLRCPALFTYGAVELASGGVAFAGVPEALQTHAAAGQSLEILTIPGADHFYSGTVPLLREELVRWIGQLTAR